MELACVHTRGALGLAAPPVTVEVHPSAGLPGLFIVGLAETAVKESRERVRAALAQCGFEIPNRKLTINLAPADLPKSGGRFDLAIAIGVLAASGQVSAAGLDSIEFFGELAFSGALRRCGGLLPALIAIQRDGRRAVVPAASAAEVALLRADTVRLAGHLIDVVRHLQGEGPLAVATAPAPLDESPAEEDLQDIQGQAHAKRALEIAAAGAHHLLLIGPPGTGKSMLARRLPALLPPLSEPEAIETAAIYSLVGAAPGRHWRRRPFRAPHHSASVAAVVGGSNHPRPGEISLAHHGVLFLDELPEYHRPVLEALREPIEAGRIAIARARGTLEFPAQFQLVAAMNPCPCGFAGDTAQACRCSPEQVRQYQQRLSGPFLDRLEIRLQMARSELRLDAPPGGETSLSVRRRVMQARERQCARAGMVNARLPPSALRRWCWPDRSGQRLLERAAERLRLSHRACDSTLRVARTIADLAGRDDVVAGDIAEALTLRRELA
jgi:magnesium chelatase family protein